MNSYLPIIIVIGSILSVIYIVIWNFKKESKNKNKNAEIIKDILSNGREATATVLSALMLPPTPDYMEELVSMKVKFRIKFHDKGTEYFLRREKFWVPANYVSDFKVNNELPVTVHKNNLQWVLFEFAKTNPASIHEMFEDSEWYKTSRPCVSFDDNKQDNNSL